MDWDVQQDLTLDRRSFLQTAGGTTLLGLSGLTSVTYAAEKDIQASSQSNRKLIVHSKDPMNAEPPLADLIQSWLTPVDRFYIRSHAPVPKIDVKQFRLSVSGLVQNPLELSLDELAGIFEQTSVIATMTCAGNRRLEHHQVKPIDGVIWHEGAIGNARWGGVRLSDVLKKAGVRENAKHVWFEGLDEIERKGSIIWFGASIPLKKAFLDTDTMPGALLVNQMNGKLLTPDHGFPLRTVVPGYIGARSVKWLGRIVVSDRPSPNHYVDTAYKLVEEGQGIEWDEAAPIYRYPVNAAICTPKSGASLKSGRVTVSGYSLPSGQAETTISRVELSADGGRTWTRARLTSEPKQFCWQLWSAEIPVAATTRELIVRATDSRGKTQPDHVDWNFKGYLFNAWHRIGVHVTS
jgi:sulfite oxidase